MVEARCVMALRQPRDTERARNAILALCSDPTFAGNAIYSRPVGGQKVLTDLSIRFAEAALALWRNVLIENHLVCDGDDARVIHLTVMDVQENVSYETDLVVKRAVERHFVPDGRVVLGQRETSKGERIFLLRATEDEMAMIQNSALSRAIRTNGLRLLPTSVRSDALIRIYVTLAQQAKAIIQMFSEFQVSVPAIENYLQCPVDRAKPEQVAELRGIINALREGDHTWAEFMGKHVKPVLVAREVPRETHPPAVAASAPSEAAGVPDKPPSAPKPRGRPRKEVAQPTPRVPEPSPTQAPAATVAPPSAPAAAQPPAPAAPQVPPVQAGAPVTNPPEAPADRVQVVSELAVGAPALTDKLLLDRVTHMIRLLSKEEKWELVVRCGYKNWDDLRAHNSRSLQVRMLSVAVRLLKGIPEPGTQDEGFGDEQA
jgi:hypothetical protein